MSRSFTNQTENDVLNWLFGTSTFELQLFTTLPNDDGVGTQPSGAANYSAQPIVFGPAASGVISNTSQVVFPGPTAPWGKIVAWAVKDTVAGVVRSTGYMGTFLRYAWQMYAPTDRIYPLPFVPLADGTRVFFVGRDPDGVTCGSSSIFGVDRWEDALTEYYSVESDGVGFKVSLTQGGAAVDIADMSGGNEGFRGGDFQIWESKTITPGLGDLLVFAPGTISISLK